MWLRSDRPRELLRIVTYLRDISATGSTFFQGLRLFLLHKKLGVRIHSVHELREGWRIWRSMLVSGMRKPQTAPISDCETIIQALLDRTISRNARRRRCEDVACHVREGDPREAIGLKNCTEVGRYWRTPECCFAIWNDHWQKEETLPNFLRAVEGSIGRCLYRLRLHIAKCNNPIVTALRVPDVWRQYLFLLEQKSHVRVTKPHIQEIFQMGSTLRSCI
jgi:hypothetical protein